MRSRVWVLAAALALSVGCGNASPPDAATQDQGGTPLGFGFTTVAGTALQGPVFAQPLERAEGFVAVMTLTGDPVEVYDAFAGQAARMGFRMQSSALVCTFSGDDGLLYAPDGNAAGWTQRPDDADALFCGTTSEVYRGEDVENAAYLQLAVSQGELAGETQSTVVLDLRRHGVVPEAAPEPAPEPGARGLGEQVAWEPPSRFGLERGAPSMDVEEGSALVGPVASRASCAGGYYAVLEVSGDLDAVTDAYEAQIEEKASRAKPRPGPRACAPTARPGAGSTRSPPPATTTATGSCSPAATTDLAPGGASGTLCA
jgi:hypothetical protein